MINSVIGFDGVYWVGFAPSNTPACGGALVPLPVGAAPAALATISATEKAMMSLCYVCKSQVNVEVIIRIPGSRGPVVAGPGGLGASVWSVLWRSGRGAYKR